MADAVSTRVLLNTGDTYVVLLHNLSDGTGESAVVKVDKSTLINADGAVPSKLRIMAVQHNIQGFPYVKLAFDATTDDTALILSGDGRWCLEQYGGLKDPASTGATGDIVLTAPAGASTGSYSILLHIEKN